jgi:23S rRNA (guanosine2251-2'-O)-methyltransferase
MGAEAVSTGSGRSGSGKTKKGKPRPGTGGYGRRALEGKGPTPPAAMRPGHPAQRRAAAAGSRGQRRTDDTAAYPSRSARGSAPPSGSSARAPRGSGDAPEFVAGRNPVVESLRAAVPAAALYVGTRVQHD